MARTINVEINGQFVRKDNKNAGVMGEGNVTTMSITFDETWRGFGKRIVWRDANGENPVSVILFDGKAGKKAEEPTPMVYTTTIPREPLEIPGWCSFSIEGYKEEDGVHKVSFSVSDTLMVAQSDSYHKPAEPTPSQTQQILEALAEAEENVSASATEAKSWAVGGTGTRPGEDTDNAKYYAGQAEKSSTEAGQSAANAATSAEHAAASEEAAKQSSNSAAMWAIAAQDARNEANEAKEQAELSAAEAAASASAAKDSEENAGFKSSEAARYSAESKLWAEGTVDAFSYPRSDMLAPGETKKMDAPQFVAGAVYEISGTRKTGEGPTISLGEVYIPFSEGGMNVGTRDEVNIDNSPGGGIVYKNSSSDTTYDISIKRTTEKPEGFMSAKDWAGEAASASESAGNSARDAFVSKSDSALYSTKAAVEAQQAESWAVGGTGSRDGEDTNNAKYWSGKAKEYAEQAASGGGGGGDSYVLPAATSDALGGVKADAVMITDTQAVRIGSDNKLYTAPGGKSPYDIAVEQGYTGTQEEFNAALAALGDLNAMLDAINGEQAWVPGLPAVSSADNGKILAVVDGKWASTLIPSAEGVSF